MSLCWRSWGSTRFRGLRIADCGLRIVDCGLRILDFRSAMTQVLERPAAATGTSEGLDRRFLLNDDQVMSFVVRGYLLVRPELPAGFNESVVAALEGLKKNPGNGILDAVPQ